MNSLFSVAFIRGILTMLLIFQASLAFGQTSLEPLKTIELNGQLTSLDIHPSEPLVITGDRKGLAYLVNIETGQIVQEWQINRSRFNLIRFSPDGNKVAVADGVSGETSYWDLETLEPDWRQNDHENGAFGICFLGGDVLTSGLDGTVQRRSVSDGIPIETLDLRSLGLSGFVGRFGCNADDSSILLTSVNTFNDELVSEVSLTTKERITDYVTEVQSFVSAYSADAQRVAATTLGGEAYLWNRGQVEPAFTYKTDGPASALVFDKVGNNLAFADESGKIYIGDVKTGMILTSLKAHSGEILGLSFVNVSNQLASIGYDGKLIIWELR